MTDHDVHVRRSTLVVPANRPKMIEKAIGTEADVLMLDMEDAVAYTDSAKAEAQKTVVDARRNLDFGDKEVIIRLNVLGSEWFEGDLEACLEARPHAIVPAKISSPHDLEEIDRRITAAGAGSNPRIWVGLETVSAVMRSEEIALASPRVELLRFGVGDYTVTMRGQFTDSLDHLHFPLTKVLATARMMDLDATAATVVFADLKRLDLVKEQALLLRRLGFDGSTVIHPSHIAPVHEAFTPTLEEIEWAQRQEELLANAVGQAVVVVDGRLVEMVHLKLARRTLAIGRKLGMVPVV